MHSTPVRLGSRRLSRLRTEPTPGGEGPLPWPGWSECAGTGWSCYWRRRAWAAAWTAGKPAKSCPPWRPEHGGCAERPGRQFLGCVGAMSSGAKAPREA
jgi:hypothetical protein